jgi:hypothetical protein
MSEMAAALRQIADRLDAGALGLEFVPTSCALVLNGPDGKVSATYIGREVPADMALVFTLARGIEQTVNSTVQGRVKQAPSLSYGSTH